MLLGGLEARPGLPDGPGAQPKLPDPGIQPKLPSGLGARHGLPNGSGA